MTTNTASQSTSKFNLQRFGPGILMASAAIGGSHLIASTQAGAIYGWQLAIMIILANVLKYPFFRFSAQYAYETGESLVAGYAKKGKVYLVIFFLLSVMAAAINTGAVAMLCAVILGSMLPESWGLSVPQLSMIVLAITWVFLLAGRYKLLDGVTKIIIIALTLTTVAAVVIAAGKPSVMQPDFISPSPWNMATLGFIIALMGWMPAPIEISAINSMWISAKQKIHPNNYADGLLDFNVGYITSTVLALVFLALGVFVQHGSGEEIALKGFAYVNQLIAMYTTAIGDWSKLLVAFIAFACMFGTTITVADGYGRITAESSRLLGFMDGQSTTTSTTNINVWISYCVLSGLVIILYFSSALGEMLRFAMITAFLAAPVFAWLNYSLVRGKSELSNSMIWLSRAGLVFLAGFAVLFVLQLAKII